MVQFFRSLEGPSKAVLEACWNWGVTHDLLEEIAEVEEVLLAHPLKTRLIADAQIKTGLYESRMGCSQSCCCTERDRFHHLGSTRIRAVAVITKDRIRRLLGRHSRSV